MKLINLALAILFVIPLAYAFDCNYFSGSEKTDCLELQSINESLIPDLIYGDSSFPNHNSINDYNKNIEVEPLMSYNSGNIRNAWLEVPYIYPSRTDVMLNFFGARREKGEKTFT